MRPPWFVLVTRYSNTAIHQNGPTSALCFTTTLLFHPENGSRSVLLSAVFLIARCSPFFINASTASGVGTAASRPAGGQPPSQATVPSKTKVCRASPPEARFCCSPAFTFIGACTCVFAATIAIFQTDLKRVIANSTCSQLGYMIFACGLGNFGGSLFHLFTHGFFKALLFLSAGVIIHACRDEQDMRRFGGLRLILPIAYVSSLAGSAVLVGAPFIASSKELIIALAQITFSTNSTFSIGLASASVVFSAIYTFRALLLIFGLPPNSAVAEAESPAITLLVVLASSAIFSSYLFKPMLVGAGTDFWGNNPILVQPHGH